MNFDEKRMANGSEYVSFHHDPFGLPLFLNVLLFHGFDGVEL